MVARLRPLGQARRRRRCGYQPAAAPPRLHDPDAVGDAWQL